MANRCIKLRGVEVNNLKQVDLDIPHGQLVVFCGRSGSGKTSLALDTLYAEGQRRYMESFSAYTRQFLEQLEKPAADKIEGIPPAIAVTHKNTSRSNRATIGTATEINDHLRLLYSRVGTTHCPKCRTEIRRDTPESMAKVAEKFPSDSRLLVAFKLSSTDETLIELIRSLIEAGFVRYLIDQQITNLRDPAELDKMQETISAKSEIYVLVDRLTAGKYSQQRLLESIETCFHAANNTCYFFLSENHLPQSLRAEKVLIDEQQWWRVGFSQSLTCVDCELELPKPEPPLFSFNSPRGACANCEGFGNVIDLDMELIVPDPAKSIADGAIAPWNSKAYAHELEELLNLAGDYDLPVDVPFRDLSDKHLELIQQGVPEREFGGLNGFFAWLERRKYKMHLRVFLSRWRSYRQCPECKGKRLRPEALATTVGGKNIAEFCQMKIRDALEFIENLKLSTWQQSVGQMMLSQIQSRLTYLVSVGLGYLTLERTLRTLSGGESQRVALTSALGSSLVNMLYVLDEPSVGLHPQDVQQLSQAIGALRQRQNTVVVVEA